MEFFQLSNSELIIDMAQLLKTDGTIQEIEPQNGKDFSLGELYKAIGCETIEVIYLSHETGDDDNILIGDEEARLIDEPEENPEATRLWVKAWGRGYGNLVGNMILCKSKELR